MRPSAWQFVFSGFGHFMCHPELWPYALIPMIAGTIIALVALLVIFGTALAPQQELLSEARTLAQRIADGPTFANAMTKTMLDKEWNMGIDQFIEAEAQAQAICMQTEDFARAYHAFAAKEKPVFEGN